MIDSIRRSSSACTGATKHRTSLRELTIGVIHFCVPAHSSPVIAWLSARLSSIKCPNQSVKEAPSRKAPHVISTSSSSLPAYLRRERAHHLRKNLWFNETSGCEVPGQRRPSHATGAIGTTRDLDCSGASQCFGPVSSVCAYMTRPYSKRRTRGLTLFCALQVSGRYVPVTAASFSGRTTPTSWTERTLLSQPWSPASTELQLAGVASVCTVCLILLEEKDMLWL